jgi:hypothetical protein
VLLCVFCSIIDHAIRIYKGAITEFSLEQVLKYGFEYVCGEALHITYVACGFLCRAIYAVKT